MGLVRDSAINLLDLFLRIIIGGALYLIILTHYFPPSELALYYLYVSLFNILALVVSAPLTAQFDKILDSKQEARHALGAIALLSFLESLAILWYMDGRGGLPLVLFTVILNLVNNATLLKFYNIEKNRLLYSSIPYVLKVVITWVFAYLGLHSFEDILWASLLPYFGVIYLMVKEYGINLSINGLISYLRKMYLTLAVSHRGGSLFWIRVFTAIRNYLDNVIFNRPSVSDVEKTRYNTAAYVYKLFSESSGSMISINFLKYQKEGHLTKKKVVLALIASFFIMVAFAIWVIVFDALFPWVLKYNIVDYLVLLGVGYVLWSPTIIIRDTLFALNKNKEIILAEFLSLGVFVVLAWGQSPWGVAQALTMSLISGFLLYLIFALLHVRNID